MRWEKIEIHNRDDSLKFPSKKSLLNTRFKSQKKPIHPSPKVRTKKSSYQDKQSIILQTKGLYPVPPIIPTASIIIKSFVILNCK